MVVTTGGDPQSKPGGSYLVEGKQWCRRAGQWVKACPCHDWGRTPVLAQCNTALLYLVEAEASATSDRRRACLFLAAVTLEIQACLNLLDLLRRARRGQPKWEWSAGGRSSTPLISSSVISMLSWLVRDWLRLDLGLCKTSLRWSHCLQASL